MSPTPIASREAALRIALAARALNGLDVKAFVAALVEKLEPPLTESKLGKLTVEDLRTLLAGDFAEQGCHVGVEPEQLKEAVRVLWGQGNGISQRRSNTRALTPRSRSRFCTRRLIHRPLP